MCGHDGTCVAMMLHVGHDGTCVAMMVPIAHDFLYFSEDAKKEKNKKTKVDDEGDSKPDTFTEKLVTNLLKNLIVSVIKLL